MEPIKDTSLKSALDEALITAIKGEIPETVWMAIPDILDWEKQYEIYIDGRGAPVDDLTIADIIQPGDITLGWLKRKKIIVKNTAGAQVNRWSYYNCLYAEINRDNAQYLLNEAVWFKVEDDYNRQINEFYSKIKVFQTTLKVKDGEREDSYNKRLVQSDAKYCLMDKKLVSSGETRSPIEICDVYSQDKYLIHVKKGKGSSTLSHLFAQGFVSADLLQQLTFRKRVNAILRNDILLGNPAMDKWLFPEDDSFKASDYKIVYAIITGSETDRPQIPFFSKVIFRQFATTLMKEDLT